MKHGMIPKTYLAYEIGFIYLLECESYGIDLSCNVRTGDHRGFFFHLCICKLMFEFNIYDIRHEENY